MNHNRLGRSKVRNKHLKSKENLEFFYRRLDAIRMSDMDRLTAKAQFARAEAVAGFCAAIVHGIGRLLKAPAGKPPHHPAASAG